MIVFLKRVEGVWQIISSRFAAYDVRGDSAMVFTDVGLCPLGARIRSCAVEEIRNACRN